MCFIIDTKQRRWKAKTVYKVLKKHEDSVPGKLHAPLQAKLYTFGQRATIRKGQMLSFKHDGTRYAKGGLYVFRYLNQARGYAEGFGGRWEGYSAVVVRCRVLPRDFLFHSKPHTRFIGPSHVWSSKQHIATYRALVPMAIVTEEMTR
jgi:hypothetical protein